MGLCSNVRNLTVIVREFRNGKLIMVNEKTNKIEGLFGDNMDQLLDNFKNNCRLIPTSRLGVQLKNSTFTPGGLQLLQSQKGDFLFAKTNQFLIEPFFHHSVPNDAKQYSIAHEIDKSFSKDKTLNSVTTFESSLANMLYLWIFVSLLVLIIFNKINNKVKGVNVTTKKIIESYLNGKISMRYSANAIGLVLLSYSLYQMLVCLLYSNMIKTNKITIDVDKVVSSLEQLLTSRLYICWFRDTSIYRLATNSPETSILGRLYEKKDDFNQRCVINISVGHKKLDFNNKIYFMSRDNYEFLFHLFVEQKRDTFYWLSKILYQDVLLVFYYRFNLDKERANAIDKYSMYKLEHDLQSYIYRHHLKKFKTFNAPRIYENLNEFITEHTRHFDFSLNYFWPTFLLLFVPQITLIIIFLMHFVINKFKLKKKLRKLFKKLKIIK